MAKCPACGTENESRRECATCGLRLDGATESFEPVAADSPSATAPSETFEGPVLIVRKGPEVGDRFFLDRPRFTIGRDPSSDIFLNDVTVSRSHAIVENDGGIVTVRDAGSLNGTYVNGVSVDAAPLSSGDVVQVGTFQMIFLSGSGV